MTYSDWFDYWNQNSSSTSTLYSFLTYPDSNILDNTSSSSYYVYCHGMGVSFDPTDDYYYSLAMTSGITDPQIGDTQAYTVDSFRFPYEYVHNYSGGSGTDSMIVEFYLTTLPTGSVYDSGTYTLKFNPSASFLPITSDSTPRFATALYTKSASGLGRNEVWDSITAPKQRYAFALTGSGTTYTTKSMRLSPALTVLPGQKVISFIHFKGADSFSLGTDATAANYMVLFCGTTASSSSAFPPQPPHNSSTGYPGSYQTGLVAQNQSRYSTGATGFTFAGHNVLIPGVAFTAPYFSVPQQAFHVTWDFTPPFPPITGASTVCVGSSIVLSETATGGTWSSTNPAVATIDGAGDVFGVSAGTTVISYTNSSGFTTRTITVLDIPVTPTFTGATTVCTGQSIVATASETGGTWTSGSTGIATVDASGRVFGVSAGTVSITYSITNVCGSATGNESITVNASPAVGTITGRDTVCPLRSVTLTESITGGVWYSTTPSIATVSATGVVTGVAVGTDIIGYHTSNSTCTDSAFFTVHVYCTLGTTPLPTQEAERVSVYPNPNGGTFSLMLNSPVDEQATVTIYNITGQVVKEFILATNTASNMELSQPAGIYYLSATLSKGKYAEKITIVK